MVRRQTPEMEMTKMVITPEMAKEMLEHNSVNRPIRKRVMISLARDMATPGGWKLTGDPVLFDTKGNLIDGQHRLTACVQADTPFETWVGTNAEPDVQDVKDTGARRTLSDILHMRGESTSIMLASILRSVAVQDEEYEMKSSYYVPSYTRLLAMYDADPAKFTEATSMAGRTYQSAKMGSQAIWGLLWIRLTEVDYEDADEFFSLIRSGANLGPGHPVYALRRALSNMENLGALASRRKMYAMTVKAWNAWRAGTKVQTLAFKSGGKAPEAMPRPK